MCYKDCSYLNGRHWMSESSQRMWLRTKTQNLWEWIQCSMSLRFYVPVKSKLKHAPPACPRHLTSFPAQEGGNLINLVFPGAGIWSLLIGGGNLIASLDLMLRVALIPRGAINRSEDKPSCIQSERYPIRGGLAEKQRLAQALFCVWRYSRTIYIIFGM